MKGLQGTWEKVKNYDYGKMLNSKTFLIAGSVVLLIAAFIINAAFSDANEKPEDGEPTTKILGNSVLVDNNVSNVTDATNANPASAEDENYFAVATINREKVRDEAMDVLQTIIDSPDVMADTKEQALSDMASIVSEMTAEINAESLIKAKGFDECVVVISGKKANVIVKSDELLQTQVAQILDIIYSETAIVPNNVKIIRK